MNEQLAKFRAQKIARQVRYYAAHKDKINATRRNIYNLGKQKQQEPEPDPEPPQAEIHKTNFIKSRTLSYDEAVQGLESLELKPGTLSKYKQDLKRLLSISNCDNIIACFRKHKTLTNQIDTATKPDGSPYSVNTKQSLCQLILYITDHLDLPITDKIKKRV